VRRATRHAGGVCRVLGLTFAPGLECHEPSAFAPGVLARIFFIWIAGYLQWSTAEAAILRLCGVSGSKPVIGISLGNRPIALAAAGRRAPAPAESARGGPHRCTTSAKAAAPVLDVDRDLRDGAVELHA